MLDQLAGLKQSDGLLVHTGQMVVRRLLSNGTLKQVTLPDDLTPGSMANPMTTQDDLIVGGASGTPSRLAKGTDSTVLTIDPVTHHLKWSAPGVTWPLLAPDGSAAAPSYSFANSTNTGFYKDSAGSIGFAGSLRSATFVGAAPTAGDIAVGRDANTGVVYFTSDTRFLLWSTDRLVLGGGLFGFATDNAYDIGASGANRPRNLFIGTQVKAPLGTTSLAPFTFEDGLGTGWYGPVAGSIGYTTSGGERVRFSSVSGGASISVRADPGQSVAGIGFTSTATLGALDSALYNDGTAGVLAQRNGTNSQTLRIYNSYVGANDYERLTIRRVGTSFLIAGEHAGTGSSSDLRLYADGGHLSFGINGSTPVWYLEGWTGHLKTIADNTYDIGASGASRPRDIYVANNLTVANIAGIGGGAAAGTGLYVTGTSALYCGLNVHSPVAAPGGGWGIRQLLVDGTPSTAYPGSGNTHKGIEIQTGAATGFTDNYGLYIYAPTGATNNIGLYNAGSTQLVGNLGFFGSAAVAKPTVSGAKGGNVALGSLMAALSSLGLITDSTTA